MASAATAERLAEARAESTPSRTERRRSQRHLAIGKLHAVRWDLTAESIDIDLRLLDESPEGFGAICASPLPAGSEVHVCTSPERDVWRTGVVVQCRPSHRGYRVGVAFRS